MNPRLLSGHILTKSKLNQEVENLLYVKFAETNFWKKAKFFPYLFVTLCAVGFLSWLFGVDIRTTKQMVAGGILFTFTCAVAIFIVLVIKEMAHDLPWKKYKEEHGVCGDEEVI